MKTERVVAPFDLPADDRSPRVRLAPRLWSFAVEYLLALPAGAAVALVWVNAAPESYYRTTFPLAFAVNDVGMVLFFGWITKEVVEAGLPGGVLHSWRRTTLPIALAGVMVLLSGIAHGVAVRVFGEPMLEQAWMASFGADLAFGYLVARLIFGRGAAAVPFFLLVAISIDAIGFGALALTGTYRDTHTVPALLLMGLALGSAAWLRTRPVRTFWPYVAISGTLSWAALYFGGVHPALALVPIVPFLPHGRHDPGFFVDASPRARDALSRFEVWCRHPAQVALFLFGIVNAGVPVRALENGVYALPVALLLARPLGILAGAAVGIASGLHLPKGLGWRELAVVGAISSIGFTLSLFFASSTLGVGPVLSETRMGALLSAIAAPAAVALAWLLRTGRFARRPAAGPNQRKEQMP